MNYKVVKAERVNYIINKIIKLYGLDFDMGIIYNVYIIHLEYAIELLMWKISFIIIIVTCT